MLLLFATLIATAFANPVIPHDVELPIQDISPTNYYYALDLIQQASVATMKCFKDNGTSAIFIQASMKTNNSTDISPFTTTNIQNAYQANLGTELFMSPIPQKPDDQSDDGSGQIRQLYNGLRRAGITVRTLWIEVTGADYWQDNSNNNRAFIGSLITQCQQYNLSVGILTNSYDWDMITGQWNQPSSWGVMLWYYIYKMNGGYYTTKPDFSDYKPFGNWTQPTVKMFATGQKLCGYNVNRDVYTNSNLRMENQANFQKRTGPVVGGNIQM